MLKVIVPLIFAFVLVANLYAEDEEYNYINEWNGTLNVESFLDETGNDFPVVHFNGSINLLGNVTFEEERFSDGNYCLYTVMYHPSEAKVRITGTCRHFAEEEHYLYTRYIGEFDGPVDEGINEVFILGGEGRFEGATGEGIMEWNTHASAKDPRNPGIRFMSGITKLNVQFDE